MSRLQLLDMDLRCTELHQEHNWQSLKEGVIVCHIPFFQKLKKIASSGVHPISFRLQNVEQRIPQGCLLTRVRTTHERTNALAYIDPRRMNVVTATAMIASTMFRISSNAITLKLKTTTKKQKQCYHIFLIKISIKEYVMVVKAYLISDPIGKYFCPNSSKPITSGEVGIHHQVFDSIHSRYTLFRISKFSEEKVNTGNLSN